MMEPKNIIVSERYKPSQQYITAAIPFAVIILKVFSAFYETNSLSEGLSIIKQGILGYSLLLFTSLCFLHKRRVYIDLKDLRIRYTVELSFIKLGTWQALKNLEYVSIFPRLKADGVSVFEVNLWYERNQHVNLYEEDNFEDAYRLAFRVSEYLKIDLLDSTEARNAKWIDMKASKAQGKVVYSEE